MTGRSFASAAGCRRPTLAGRSCLEAAAAESVGPPGSLLAVGRAGRARRRHGLQRQLLPRPGALRRLAISSSASTSSSIVLGRRSLLALRRASRRARCGGSPIRCSSSRSSCSSWCSSPGSASRAAARGAGCRSARSASSRSELAKFAVVLYLAHSLVRKGERVARVRHRRAAALPGRRRSSPASSLLEPDFGTAVLARRAALPHAVRRRRAHGRTSPHGVAALPVARRGRRERAAIALARAHSPSSIPGATRRASASSSCSRSSPSARAASPGVGLGAEPAEDVLPARGAHRLHLLRDRRGARSRRRAARARRCSRGRGRAASGSPGGIPIRSRASRVRHDAADRAAGGRSTSASSSAACRRRGSRCRSLATAARR